MKQYTDESIQLLKTLIAIPRTSRGEKMAADALQNYMTNCGLHPRREGNNLWAMENDYSDKRPTLHGETCGKLDEKPIHATDRRRQVIRHRE